jgi:hypothetical protein
MKEILTQAGTYAGELIISAIAIIIRSIEKKIIIRRKRREWIAGEKYSTIEKNQTGQK